MYTMTQTSPTTTIRPAAIQVEKSIASSPKTASMTLQGTIQITTMSRPAAVYASRSETPSRRTAGTSPTRTSEMPSSRGVAWPAAAPDRARTAPRPTPSAASVQRPRLPCGGGSGRSRMAVEMVMRLTRQAETATTARVSRTPRP